MSSYEQTMIIGNLGRDPELRYTQGGKAVCNFSVAVNKVVNDRTTGEKRESVKWYNVSVWGAMGENCNRYLAKGRQVMVIGEIATRAYTSKDGQLRASLDLNARQVQFLSGGTDEGGSSSNGDYQDEGSFSDPPKSTDDIPF